MIYIIAINKKLKEILNKENLDKKHISKHEETINHVCLCYIIAKEFGLFLNLSENDVETLSNCALLHDLGKFHINPEILYKKTFLSDDEFDIIKSHVNYKSNSIINDIVLNCIKYHHERPDNMGYSENDYSKVLPFTKIISIIDSFDVMSNKRSYKSTTLNLESAINEIRNNIGKQFDEYYGNLFISFLETKINKKE